MTRSECLDSAKNIVNGDREASYGRPEDNFKIIAGLWGAYKGADFTAEDVAMMMILLKVARSASGNYKADNYVDICGYAACAAEIGESKETEEAGHPVNWLTPEDKKRR